MFIGLPMIAGFVPLQTPVLPCLYDLCVDYTVGVCNKMVFTLT